MKIAIFTNTYWPSRNGVAIAIKLLRECLIALGHTVLVFAPAYPGKKYNDPEGVFRFSAFGFGDYPLAKLLFVRNKARRILIEQKVELVYLPHPWWVSSLGLSLAKELDLATVSVIHTQYDKMVKAVPLIGWLAKRSPIVGRLIGRILWWKVRRFCNAVDMVTTPGFGMQKHLVSLGVNTPVWLTPNPTNLEGFGQQDSSAIRAKLDIPTDSPVIGYTGRLVAEKNPDQLLAAFALIRGGVQETHLLIIGDGEMRAGLERQAAKIGNVHFAGSLDHSLVAKYLAACNLFLSASTFEVQPLTYVEALASGLPIVAYRSQGNEVVSDNENGRLISLDKGPAGLAAAVIDLIINRTKLTAMSKRARVSTHQFEKVVATKRTVEALCEAKKRHDLPES